MALNIFVIGLDDFNRKMLETIRGSENYRFHGLLEYDQVVNPEHYPIREMIESGKRQLDGFGGRIDAIIGHWDFPTTALLPIFREHCGLAGPSLESVLIAEHKYWCRLRQQASIPEHVPRFQPVDPFAVDAADGIELDYPFWLKPVIAYSSHLAFKIHDRKELDEALAQIRSGIGRFGEPFQYFVDRAALPADVPVEVGGYHCVAEAPIGGDLCTAEGYIRQGKVHVFGIVDSYREGRYGSSFSRYQLPSRLPEPVQAQIVECTQRVVPALGLDDTAFNIEYFWNAQQDRVWLLEVNVRVSKSHSPLFADVVGASNHEVAVDVALGKAPDYPRQEGCCAVAAKFMLRRYQDARVTRVPTEQELRTLESKYPGTYIEIAVEEGQWLSELPAQDPYSYEVAVVFLGGPDTETLLQEYQQLVAELPLEFESGEVQIAQ